MTQSPLILTLDAGGTTFTFSAIRNGREAVKAFTVPSLGEDLDACLDQIRRGFDKLHGLMERQACAISFGFPGPADYPNGIIGDLGNLPAFRGGVALGPMLEDHFRLPVFINNDADLFALGEALAGRLPETNAALEAAGNPFRHRHLLGLTLGTGFGAGIVADGRLLRGDNASGGSIWLVRSNLFPSCFAEEGVSIRGLRRAYAAAAAIPFDAVPNPKALADLARGRTRGNCDAAREAFRAFGEAAGDAIANALTLVDGLVVLGGGLCGASDLFLPALVGELNGTLSKREGGTVPRLESRVFNLDDEMSRQAFLSSTTREIPVPGSNRRVSHDPVKRIGLCLTKFGTARSSAIGAWIVAMEALGLD